MSEAAATADRPEPEVRPGEPIMEVRDLVKHFPIRSGLLQRQVGRASCRERV